MGRAVAVVREVDRGQRGVDPAPDRSRPGRIGSRGRTPPRRRRAPSRAAPRDPGRGARSGRARGVAPARRRAASPRSRLPPGRAVPRSPSGASTCRRRRARAAGRARPPRWRGPPHARPTRAVPGGGSPIRARRPRPAHCDRSSARASEGEAQTGGWSRPTANSRSTPVLTSARTSSHAPRPATRAPLATDAIPYTSQTSAPASR